MEENLIMSPNNVAKIGDTQIDMLEGINANCGLVIGVLSGHEKRQFAKCRCRCCSKQYNRFR